MSEALAALYESHPAPWRIDGDELMDADGIRLNTFDGDDACEVLFWQGIADAVNAQASARKAAAA